jgi:hypothetical protein
MYHDASSLARWQSDKSLLTPVAVASVRTNAPVETVDYLQSVIPPNRLDYLVEKCRETLRRCPGHVLEIGVYRGGSLSRLAQLVEEVCPEYRVIGIDTFSGHPYSDGHPVHPLGKYADVDLGRLTAAFAEQPYGGRIGLHTGRVENILQDLRLHDVAFAHIDCDLFRPVAFCAATLPALMKRGGLLYFDDYGHDHCPGATRAVDEAFPPERINQVYMPDDGTCWSCHVRLDDLDRA